MDETFPWPGPEDASLALNFVFTQYREKSLFYINGANHDNQYKTETF